MANIDEVLLGKKYLNGADEEARVESRLRRERMEKTAGGSAQKREGEGDSLNQMMYQARRRKINLETEKRIKAKKSAGFAVGAGQATAGLLKAAWLNLIDSFGLTLIYINLHIFGRSVFGERIFCELGQEWIPTHLRSSLESPAVKAKIKRFALIEKTILIFLDLLVLFCLLGITVIIVILVDLSLWDKTKIIIGASWELVKSLFAP